ncbi:AAA family ATPase [Piscinibacter sp. HJYY11]|uniref:ATP-binding protein n=1 Tax=Piscinibacter sp. HJYY11 TaxID=2801333 RepID=UPI00191EE894|nr:adenylate/guanylate cyclase domain-containing protein [Piscinibacter sp. HJYY11]MBL0728981.1 AAA family ATPase [Piscinibacter sp. HJYY11]
MRPMPPQDLQREAPASRQRHVLTVLFSDLVGSTLLGRKVDAELLADLIDELRHIWRQAAEDHGGMLLRTQGDGGLLIFGYPHPCEDGGRRAAEAALDIHQRANALTGFPHSPPPRMRSGIAAGVVVLSPGDIERGRLDLVGDVANSAAGLLKSAPAGSIVAFEAALGPHANFFTHVPGQLPLTLSILGRSNIQRRIDATAARGLTTLVDRDGPLDQLRAFLSHESATDTPCMLLEAEAGMGKTRMLDEVIPRVSGTVLYGTCESYLRAEVLQPFMQMLRGRTMPDGLALDASVPVSTERLMELFCEWAAREPLSLVVDDWQWADDASRQLVQGLLQRAPRVAILLACRPRDDGARWIVDAPRLELMPLSLAGTTRAVHQWQPQVDPFLARRIHAHTGGVPLYVEELCRSASPLMLAQWLDGEEGGTPSWLAAWVVGRLKRLPQDLADLVRAAAVAGNTVPVHLLQAVTGHTCDAAVIQALAHADFLYPAASAGKLLFKHGLARDAVYKSIGLRERERLHAAYFELLAQDGTGDGQPEILAYHCRGASQWEQAASQAESAGDRASAAFALDSARQWYASAMDALDRVPDRDRSLSLKWCLVSNKLGMTCIFDPLAQGNDPTPFEHAVALARTLGDADTLARAQYWLGYMYYGFGRFRESERQLRDSRSVAEQARDVRLVAQVDATLAQVLAAASRYDEALPVFDEALAAKRRQSKPGSSMAIGSAYSLSCKGSILADRGEFDEAHRCFDEALALLGGTTHPVANSVRNWVAVALVWQGRWREAEEVAAESARIAENTRGLLLLVVCRAAAGYARWAGAGDPEGLVQTVDAVNWMSARGGRFYNSLHYGWLADAYATLGDVVRTRQYAAHTLWRTREGERLGEACCYRALARLAVRDGQFQRASTWLDRAARSATLRGSRREAALNLSARAEMLRRQGKDSPALALEREAHGELIAMGMHWHAERVAGAS